MRCRFWGTSRRIITGGWTKHNAGSTIISGPPDQIVTACDKRVVILALRIGQTALDSAAIIKSNYPLHFTMFCS